MHVQSPFLSLLLVVIITILTIITWRINFRNKYTGQELPGVTILSKAVVFGLMLVPLYALCILQGWVL